MCEKNTAKERKIVLKNNKQGAWLSELWYTFKRPFLKRSMFMQPTQRKIMLFFAMIILCVTLESGCVTQTERIYPYERAPKDESVWEELRREFGWQKRDTAHRSAESTEPFYKRAAQGMAETVSGWFSNNDDRLSEQEIAADRRRFNSKREEALQRLREQQEPDRILDAE
jgi:hypothetical protein